MPTNETFLSRAIADGHAELTGEGKQQKIRYVAAGQTERYADPEEQVRAEFWAELIYHYGYEPGCIGIEIIVPRRTPAGGVLSPMLANVYLHWFDHLFQRADGPAQWAKAKLVRYADDFVVLARYISPQLREWIEGKLEGWLGLHINREKTRVLNLQQSGQSLDFLGYTFRYDRDQYGRGTRRYLNLQPSRKAMARERE